MPWLSGAFIVLAALLRKGGIALSQLLNIRISRLHFYPVDLNHNEHRVTLKDRKSFFAKDDVWFPRFRSKQEIDEDSQAPRTQVLRSALPPIGLTTPTSSVPSRGTGSSAEARKLAEEQREEADFTPKEKALKAKLLVTRAELDDLKAQLEAQKRIKQTHGKLSWDRICNGDLSKEIKIYTGFENAESLRAFYDLANYNGQCENLQLYRGLEKDGGEADDDEDETVDGPDDSDLVAGGGGGGGAEGLAGGGSSSSSTSGVHSSRTSSTRTSTSTSCSSAKRRRGRRRRVLSGQNALVLTLFLLRTGSTAALAASLFGVSKTTVNRYFTTWICFLDGFLGDLFP